MRRRFFTLDVFTDRRFAGNPLAVVLESEGLDTAAMQAIAREFNLSETVFVQRPANATHRAKLRIFTPGRELPFAGHPTVGTAVLLALQDGGGERELVLEEAIGDVRCAAAANVDQGYARFDIPRLPQRVGEAEHPDLLAAALSLAPGGLGCDELQAAKWSAGNAFTFVPVRTLAAVTRARADMTRWDAAFGGKEAAGAFLFCRETVDARNDFHARMFAPAFGIAEDPATGSAAAAFAGLLAANGMADGEHTIRIEQGYEMGRPSLIELRLTIRADALAGASVGGEAVLVMQGTVEA
jgi:trans-2,3-dihydro-3-hydroxyanthranilate isomerase